MRIALECKGISMSVRLSGVAWEAQLSMAHNKLSHIEMLVRAKEELEPLFDLSSTVEKEFH